MAGNRLGTFYSLMTFGESHGPYIGVVIDGIKPGLPIDVEEIQREMNRRRPGQSAVTTPRQEKDRIQIVSGIFQGKTTGTPICILIPNEDPRSKDYSHLKEIFRPGHAAFTYLKKYGIFDYRGGGRASGRETAARVAAGAIAKQVLRDRGIRFYGFTRQVGPYRAEQVDYQFIEQNPVRCCDPEMAPRMEAFIREVAAAGDSIGGIVELHIQGLPAGLGDPVFEKLDAELAHGLMSIGAVKGIEFGEGFRVAELRGSENNDPFHVTDTGEILPRTNHAGGVLGGISTGRDVVLRLAVKPPSSIGKAQVTVDHAGREVTYSTGGRHDPCICPRVVPVAEAMAALVVLDLLLVQEAIADSTRAGPTPDEQALALTEAQLLLLLRRRAELRERLSEAGTSPVQVGKPETPGASATPPADLEAWCAELDLPVEPVRRLWEILAEVHLVEGGG
ncbi:MAG: chorismate synthase [Calditrichaeota bacterium]|nr:MAG: chorismate synthase [Calditrichota bacterium]